MDNIIARYEDYLIHTKHASANTVSSYMRDIRQYASYLSGIDVDVLDADQSVVSAYMQWLQSRHGRFSSLKSDGYRIEHRPE